MIAPCRMEEREGQKWCLDCKRFHIGHTADLAADLSEKGNAYRRIWRENFIFGKPEPKKLLRTLPLVNDCLHRGKKNPPAKPGCGSCSTWDCTVHGQVKLDFCMGKCNDWKSKSDALPAVEVTSKSIRIDHTNFLPEIPGLRFNSSIIESGTGYIYAFRNGWRGSNIYAARMNHYFEPTGEWAKLELTNKGARVGREDCRLFRLNGKLHVSYTGYTGRNTNVLFARINEDTLKVEDVFFPQIVGRQSWEKNIVMFDYMGISHGIYSTNPHKILRIEGNKTEWAYETPFTGSWAGGHMRGGASPVMHAGLWYHFFHGSTQYQGRRVYNMGLVTFKPEPPFEIVSYTPEPIDVADTNVAHDNYCHVLFPGGAVYKNGRWIIAHGIHDRWSELRFYDSAWIESQLVPMEKVGHVDKPLPSILQRTSNYLAELSDHAANKYRTVPLSVRDERATICDTCEHKNRKKNACSLCGCPLNEDNILGDKLSWEVARCPDGRW